MSTSSAIRIDNLSFRHPRMMQDALSRISLVIGSGQRFGLFGPNGAGKTTLMSLMNGVTAIQKGSLSVFESMRPGQAELKSISGYVPQELAFYPELNAIENLNFFGAMYGMKPSEIKKRSQELIEAFGLQAYLKLPLQYFSGGMKRRINLAIGVMHRPRILFLDEPTVGVDVQSRIAIVDFLKRMNDDGTTLIYTSHLLKEAEDLCTHVAMIDKGEIIAFGSLSTMTSNGTITLENKYLELTGVAYRD